MLSDKKLFDNLPMPGNKMILSEVPEGLEPFVLARAIAKNPDQPVLHVVNDDAAMARLSAGLGFTAPEVEVITFPAWDCLPYDRVSPHSDIVARRVNALTRLVEGVKAKSGLCVITTAAALMQRMPPRETFQGLTLSFKRGDAIDREKLAQFLSDNGYLRVDTVREAGEFAIRGGIIDLFPSGEESPVRLDLFGDEIETIKSFDPLTQLSGASKEQFALTAMGEIILSPEAVSRFRTNYRQLAESTTHGDQLYESISAGRKHQGQEHWLPLFYEQLETLFDYLPDALIILDQGVEATCVSFIDQVIDYYQARLDYSGPETAAYHPLPPESLYLSADECEQLWGKCGVLSFTPFAVPDSCSLGGRKMLDFASTCLKSNLNVYEELKSKLQGFYDRQILITACSEGSGDRLVKVLKEHGVGDVTRVDSWQQLAKGHIGLAILEMEQGVITSDLVIITEQDILGERLARVQQKQKRTDLFIAEASALGVGDLVVHTEHGIGKYQGLKTVDVEGVLHDCLSLEYHGGDKLFIPVENLEVLTRYGSDEGNAQLDRLGSVAWQNRKARIKERIHEIADDLIKVAANRTIQEGEVLEHSGGVYQEFCARFPYVETDDQEQAIADTINDLKSGRPVDRLICGDVGFGKTEVALRAAFVAAVQGKQVAVVVPTTLLCRQHFQTFVERFKGFNLRVELLSRLVPAGRKKQIQQDLANGEVDIIIGTHALLSKSVSFKKLGLLIIDEEQHFGVTQKERLKQLKHNVHVITLTATPIPRTLQMALNGVRDMSLIATPPIDRLAVRSFVMPFDGVVIREAILREYHRGGQVFYVCPRVKDLTGVQEILGELVPEVKVAVAHGQMSATMLEAVMMAFYSGEYDVLLSTTIIESGIDIPNANTLVVHRADMFGLAQLYQIRGRIGRSKQRGYAYFTLPQDQIISENAQKRLEVIQTLDSLGAGFQLASYDLDIRGGGNLLGEAQSGHIREVGFELYQQMLEDAITAKRAQITGEGTTGIQKIDTSWTPQINVGTTVLIPDHYVTDLSVRINLYRRLSNTIDREAIDAIATELIDRFGPLPVEVENLLTVIEMKQLCRQANIEKFNAGPKGAVIKFRHNDFNNPSGLVHYMANQKGAVKLRHDQKLVITRMWRDLQNRTEGVFRVLRDLAEISTRES